MTKQAASLKPEVLTTDSLASDLRISSKFLGAKLL